MLDLYRPSLTGARANLTATDVIANNIANVQTPGFRATRVEFADLLYRQLAPEDIGLPPDDTSVLPTVGTGVTVLATTPSLRPGAQVPTARALDIAIDGPGFFVVRLADGTSAYSRAGAFSITSDRTVVTSEGLRLQPQITIPQEVRGLRVQPDGAVVSLDEDGVVQTHGQIQLATFASPGALEAIGSSLYRESASSGPAVLVDPGTDEAGRLRGATLEMANTDLAEEFANSVVVQRAFQMNLAALRQADEMLELLARLGR
jgi:flagellar basal-body rod protein FlgG